MTEYGDVWGCCVGMCCDDPWPCVAGGDGRKIVNVKWKEKRRVLQMSSSSCIALTSNCLKSWRMMRRGSGGVKCSYNSAISTAAWRFVLDFRAVRRLDMRIRITVEIFGASEGYRCDNPISLV